MSLQKHRDNIINHTDYSYPLLIVTEVKQTLSIPNLQTHQSVKGTDHQITN